MAKSSKKTKPLYFCAACGNESPQWFGRCPACGEWNTLKEAPRAERGGRRPGASRAPVTTAADALPMGRDVDAAPPRIPFGIGEWDRTLGGGLVAGSLVLLGGDPGVGKSTLAMQGAGALSKTHKVLYVTGEESRRQVALRAARLGGTYDEVVLYPETDVARVEAAVAAHAPALVVVDSIQTAVSDTVEGTAGSVSQIRECGLAYHRIAKSTGAAVLLIGHVTKEGIIAGPRLLEHMVDTVLYLEGERLGGLRVLRAVKNRFGSIDEVGLFEMAESGLLEVADPSQVFLEAHASAADGSAVVITIEGTRPLLLEVQALVTSTAYGTGQRVATGFDPKRLALLVAVLRKHAGVDIASHDIFLNVVAGIRINEPAGDLAVAAALVSSLKDTPLPERTALFGEVGLGGELRAVSQADRRVGEARRVGFEKTLVPHANWRDLGERNRANAVPVRTVREALAALELTGAKSDAQPFH